VILAAGEGKRMKSATPKVLHSVAGRSLLGHVIEAAATLEPQHLVVVVGHGREQVQEHIDEIAPWAVTVVQEEQKGTGHAVRVALAGLAERGISAEAGPVVVLTGDTPLLTGGTLVSLLLEHTSTQASATVLTARLDDPTGYGRIVREADGAVSAIVEHKDADEAHLRIDEINSGMYAFDSAALADALGRLTFSSDLGEGIDEGMLAPGDSGGPAFIGNEIAGVGSYTAGIARLGVNPDIDDKKNSSFGEIGAWQRVSYYQQWIDQNLRTYDARTPKTINAIQKEINEGASGTSLTYFLVQFSGDRSNPNQIVSVDYATKNGTAVAGEDYIETHGRLNLYPGENHAVIPVEVIGDMVSEPNEYFFLEVFNPIGGEFAGDAVSLIAMRTIIDDDIAYG